MNPDYKNEIALKGAISYGLGPSASSGLLMPKVIEAEMRALENFFPNATETAQGIYSLVLAGVFCPSDLVLLSRWQVEGDCIRISRRKSAVLMIFRINAFLRSWLQTRFERGGVWAGYYIFPELLFGRKVWSRNNLNNAELSFSEENMALPDAVRRLKAEFNRFLQAAGVTRQGIGFRSFKHS